MTRIFWLEFGIFFAAALIGGVAVLPYALRLFAAHPPNHSLLVLLLLASLQNAVLFGLIIGLGLLAARAIGLGAPYIEAALAGTRLPSPAGLILAVSLGVALGVILLVGDLFFLPYWPQALRETAPQTTLLENFLASLYGGINEELLTRLFGLSILAWLFAFVSRTKNGYPTLAVFWTANVAMAILFGMGHLPALKNLLGTIPPLMLARALLLNAPVALACGWLFWTYGIEAAMVAHFSTDIIYHVIGTAVLRGLL